MRKLLIMVSCVEMRSSSMCRTGSEVQLCGIPWCQMVEYQMEYNSLEFFARPISKSVQKTVNLTSVLPMRNSSVLDFQHGTICNAWDLLCPLAAPASVECMETKVFMSCN